MSEKDIARENKAMDKKIKKQAEEDEKELKRRAKEEEKKAKEEEALHNSTEYLLKEIRDLLSKTVKVEEENKQQN